MNKFFESYLSREKSIKKKKTNEEKDQEVEAFIDTTGIQRWLAKIVFRDQVQRIYESE